MAEAENFLKDSESMDVEECGTENVVRVRVIQASFKPVVSEADRQSDSCQTSD